MRRLADDSGRIVGLAIDHRDSFRAALERRGFGDIGLDAAGRIKSTIVGRIGPMASSIMLDLEYGRDALEDGVIGADKGLIMPLEAQGYEAAGDERRTSLMPDFGPSDAIRWGADACKLLLPHRPDMARSANQQHNVLVRAVRDCHRLGLPLVAEPVIYQRTDEDRDTFGAIYMPMLLDTVRRMVTADVDLLKLPYPLLADASTNPAAEMDACQELTAACSGVPWVLLGAGVDDDTFLRQLRVAGLAGASGFLVGRTVWSDALTSHEDEVLRAMDTHCLPLFEQFSSVASSAMRSIN